jgi:hypothetical protein
VVRFQAERFHTQALSFHVGPQQLHGIELLAFPHALASVVVWIGHLQWLRLHGYRTQERPILKKLQPIVQGDSLALDWPTVEAIIGNPPFIGGKRLRSALGDATVDALFASWDGRVAREADYVCYWFEKARAAVVAGRALRVGLLATNSLRQGKNREVLERILRDTNVFFAESDREWTLEGASVRVSMVGFGAMELNETRTLDGNTVSKINPDLTSSADLSLAKRLHESAGIGFIGGTPKAPFTVDEQTALKWISAPTNPNGRPNSDVLKRWVNGRDILTRGPSQWIIDFGLPYERKTKIPGELYLSEAEASFYELPFLHVQETVYPLRKNHRERVQAERPWLHARPAEDMRAALSGLFRYIGSPTVAKHRIFAWIDGNVLPDHQVAVFATEDDAVFGLVQSRIHEIWALATGSTLEDRPAYRPTNCFETFPLPLGFRTTSPPPIANAARVLHEARDRWLNPEGADEATLKKRTLTALYNEREAGRATWLNNLHRDLDRAVLAAYGWSDLAEPLFAAEDALRAANPQGDALGLALGRTEPGQALLGRLLALNLERASEGSTGASAD